MEEEPTAGPRPARRRRVVVGVDGSEDAVLALVAASRAAAVLDAELVVATIRSHEVAAVPLAPEVEGTLTAVQAAAVDRAFAGDARPAHCRLLTQGDPAHELMRSAQHADLLVVGGRGRGGFPGLLLGSVALLCVLHAPCPVLVVRGEEVLSPVDTSDAPGARMIVVGADRPTPRSIAVVRDAMRAAELLEAGLVVVSAWRPPDDLPAADPAVAQLALRAQEHQRALVHAAFGADPPIRLGTVLREGSPAGVLVNASGDADLLVVGADDRDLMTGTLLGPIALTAAAHARCPVLVMHGGIR